MKKDKKKNKKKLCYALIPCIRIIKLFYQKYHNKKYKIYYNNQTHIQLQI